VSLIRPLVPLVLALSIVLPVTPADAADGQMVWAAHVTLAPRWLDPGETEAAITPFLVLYAIHDALVKPMPAGHSTPSLAESWTMSPDGTTYDFTLRAAKFHNGDAVTPEDVKFRFVLKEPWPDFMTFYGTTATGAGWIVPKKHVERVGEEAYKKAPVGAGRTRSSVATGRVSRGPPSPSFRVILTPRRTRTCGSWLADPGPLRR
jgi:peptide/nickel transport system substrate-binding protein